jgi:pyruvate dehydrogenase E2 component (dihydrolipoamide acetyltransferase)
MPTEIRMPRLVDSMTHGAVVVWRTREGKPVTAGEVIAEIEIDKTTVDLEAPDAGTLTRIVVPAGSERVEVGTVLAILEQNGGPAPAVIEEAVSLSFKPAKLGNGHPEPPAESVPNSVRASLELMPALPQVEIKASPLARSMARQAGLDLSSLRGSGPAGRIVRADVLTALGFHHAPEEVPAPSPVVTLSGPKSYVSSASYDEIPHSRLRQVIAQRLSDSKRTIPHFYLEVNCRMDPLLRLRSEVQAASADGIKLSLNDFAVRAAALALRKVPDANASWTDTATRRYRRIDLAIAVATETGLVAPIVRDADRKGLAELAAEVRDLALRARDGRLRPEELTGGTFTVTNLGMYGVGSLYAIVNPPQAGILGLGAAEPRPVVVDGSIVVATMMTCTLSADHRVLDGATGARFLSTFKSLIEQPLTLLIDRPSTDGQGTSPSRGRPE